MAEELPTTTTFVGNSDKGWKWSSGAMRMSRATVEKQWKSNREAWSNGEVGFFLTAENVFRKIFGKPFL